MNKFFLTIWYISINFNFIVHSQLITPPLSESKNIYQNKIEIKTCITQEPYLGGISLQRKIWRNLSVLFFF